MIITEPIKETIKVKGSSSDVMEQGFIQVRTTELESYMMCGLKYENDRFEMTEDKVDIFLT